MSKLKKKANSLIEVLVVLGIISTTMLMAVSVIISNSLEIKTNEVQDAANGVMIQGLEIAKSPSDINTTDPILAQKDLLFSSGQKLFYTLSSFENRNVLQRAASQEVLLQCSAESEYALSFSEENVLFSFPTCLQIEIELTRRPGSTRIFYKIRSRVVFDLPNDNGVNTIEGYRFEEFNVINIQ